MSSLKRTKGLAARMGRWSSTHRKAAIIGWLAFIAISMFLGMNLGTRQINQNDANVGESHKADRMLSDAGFKPTRGQDAEDLSEFVLVQSPKLSVNAPQFQAAIADVTRTLKRFPQVTKLQSPVSENHVDLISPDKQSVMISFQPRGSYSEAKTYIDSISTAVDKVEARHGGFYIHSAGVSTGKAIDEEINGGLAKAGLVSIPLTIIILLLVTGSLVAALVPLLLGITAVIGTNGLLALSSRGIPADQSIMEVVLLIGLAVGVDYSLFYMRREREERAAGRSTGAAVVAAAATSGRAVLVSGITVLIAMAGMFVSGDKTFMSFSVGTMIVVAVAMLGSLTVLPAVLSLLGDRIEKGRIPFVYKRRARGSSGRLWAAITVRVLRRPALAAISAGAVLVLLALPTLQLHTAQTGMEGITSSSINPYKRLLDAFPGSPQPAFVAVRSDDVTTPEVRHAIASLRHEALATGEMNNPVKVETSPDRTVARVEIPLAGTGVDKASNHALATLREEVLPSTLGNVGGVEYAVTGVTANSEDFNKAQTSSVPKVFAFVLLFAFGLLLVSFRSIVIAIKAIALNLLSVAAAYGVLVAIFQWGWGEGLIGFQSNGGIANWLPVFMFVILFGLSMDYHVFILSRIRELYDRGASTDEAISRGIMSTAGVVTSAATVMVVVFLVFTVLPWLDLKEMGVGLAVAVLIDATIVRGVLLPATMKLLGKANWYLPKWLNWLPRLEHDSLVPEPQPTPAG